MFGALHWRRAEPRYNQSGALGVHPAANGVKVVRSASRVRSTQQQVACPDPRPPATSRAR